MTKPYAPWTLWRLGRPEENDPTWRPIMTVIPRGNDSGSDLLHEFVGHRVRMAKELKVTTGSYRILPAGRRPK